MLPTLRFDLLFSMHCLEVLSNALTFLPARTTFAPNFENKMLVAAPMPELEPTEMRCHMATQIVICS